MLRAMRILISGVCGFVGSTLARALAESGGHEIAGFDNFIRPGSATVWLSLPSPACVGLSARRNLERR